MQGERILDEIKQMRMSKQGNFKDKIKNLESKVKKLQLNQVIEPNLMAETMPREERMQTPPN